MDGGALEEGASATLRRFSAIERLSRLGAMSSMCGPYVARWTACGRPRCTCWRRSRSRLARPRVRANARGTQTRSSLRQLPETRERRRFRRACKATRGMGMRCEMRWHVAILDEAKAEARLLAELRIAGPTGKLWNQMFDAMRAAAARSASASDLKEAGRDVGLVARTCGDCHTNFGRAGVLVEPPGALSSGTQAGMRRHQWAMARLVGRARRSVRRWLECRGSGAIPSSARA